MNILTNSELAQKAKELFIKFPNMQSVTALGDGQFFDDAAGGSSSARMYAKENKLEVYSFDRSVLDDKAESPESPKGEPSISTEPEQLKAPEGDGNSSLDSKQAVAVEKMKLPELQSLATEMGLLYEPDATRAILIEMINKAKEASKD